MYEMAIVSKVDTGLQYDICIDSVGCTRLTKYGPFIKVAVDGKNKYTMPRISISTNPILKSGKDFSGRGEVIRWVTKYCEVLLKHYNHEISDKEVLYLLDK